MLNSKFNEHHLYLKFATTISTYELPLFENLNFIQNILIKYLVKKIQIFI